MWREFSKIYGINESIINIIENELKFDKITKVQNVVIPQFIKNKDVIVKACTGSGKTLAYIVPMLQKLIDLLEKEPEKNKEILAVIMLPSRELSIQVFNIILKFLTTNNLSFTYALLIGGKKIQIDLDKLSIQIPNIIIATPGRLFDLEDKLKLSFKNVEILIIDEADKMLEFGYESKITNLLEKFPKQRRTGLFSATINSQIENLIKVGMRNPVFIDIKVNISNLNNDVFIDTNQIIKKEEKDDYYQIIEIDSYKEFLSHKEQIYNSQQEVPMQLKQLYYLFDNIKLKTSSLCNFIANSEKNKIDKIIIFFATCNSVDYFSIILPKLFSNLNFYKLHSKISQKKRKTEYKKFLSSQSGILLTTDLSSRGIDIPHVDLIIQYDPPKNEEVYIHRIGRTARVGNEGQSILFIHKNEENFVKYMSQKGINMKFVQHVDENSEEYFNKIKEINKSDKWIYDKAVKSFVSFVRFYSEHDLKYIFDFNLLDIGNLANSFQLLRLPRLKEILGKKIENFVQDETLNPKDLIYQNSNTAKQMEQKEV